MKERALASSEREVLRLASHGLSNQKIAARREVSVETVKTQFRNMFDKLGARNRAHAVAIGLRTGIIE